MADADKLNIDSIIARLLEGKVSGYFSVYVSIRFRLYICFQMTVNLHFQLCTTQNVV